MGLKLANNAISRLASGITAASTSISLVPGDGALFPALGAGDYFPATLVKADGSYEIVKVTARSTDVLTVTRAQEGTTAKSFSAGDRIEVRMTAGALLNSEGLTASAISSSTDKATPADADELALADSASSFSLKSLTWANVKATLKTYFDTLYRVGSDDVSLAAGKVVIFEGTTDDAFETTLSAGNPTADRTLTLPDKTGTLATTSDVFGTSNLDDSSVTTAKIADANVTPSKLSTGRPDWDTSGNLKFNSGYGSFATAYGCRAWVNFNGQTNGIRGLGNVSSIGDLGDSYYRINFSSAMPDANYGITGSAGTTLVSTMRVMHPVNYTTGYVDVATTYADGRPQEVSFVNVAIFR